MKIKCCYCGRQVLNHKRHRSINNNTVIDSLGAKAGFKSDEVFCRDCGKELDENGLFPEEHCQEGV